MWEKELNAVAGCVEVDAAQVAAPCNRLAQCGAARRVHISNGVQVVRQRDKRGSAGGGAVKLGRDDDFGICAKAVKSFFDQLHARALARCRHIAADDVGFGYFGRVGVAVISGGRGGQGFELDFTSNQIVHHIIAPFHQRAAVAVERVAACLDCAVRGAGDERVGVYG